METPIKTKTRAQRRVAISTGECDAIDDYPTQRRPDVTDDHGRHPLQATTKGRAATSTIRSYVYRWSCPCLIGSACPHGRDPENCEAAVNEERVDVIELCRGAQNQVIPTMNQTIHERSREDAPHRDGFTLALIWRTLQTRHRLSAIWFPTSVPI